MNSTTENTIGIPNASWWENHSQVLIKEDLLAEDQEWITNNTTKVVNPGTQFARTEQSLGSVNILLIKRMVVSGVVAVKRSGDRIKTVNLPQDASKLLAQDVDYIVGEISKYNAPMSDQEQSDFLNSAGGQSEAS
jgi:hypothetical protein